MVFWHNDQHSRCSGNDVNLGWWTTWLANSLVVIEGAEANLTIVARLWVASHLLAVGTSAYEERHTSRLLVSYAIEVVRADKANQSRIFQREAL